MRLPKWLDVFGAVVARGQEALQWGLPESWVHAELYAELKRRLPLNGWRPFSTEIPYVTTYPVQLPKKTSRDWRTVGAVKWVDLCLYSETSNAWCWFEFKARHAGKAYRRKQAACEARNAYRKDVVALMGMDVNATANIWANPDSTTAAYWFEDILKPQADNLRSGCHCCVAAFMQIGGQLDLEVWGEKVLKEQIRAWFVHRNKQAGRQSTCSEVDVTLSLQPFAGDHWLVVSEWWMNSREGSNGI